MKLFLCSNFKFLAKKFLPEFFDLTKKHTALLVGYADEYGDFYSESNTKLLEELNFEVFHLDENYEFKDKIDMVFVKGGNTTKLVHLLRKFNQYDKVKELVEQGALYVGISAGSVLAGNDTEWTLRSEPYEFDVKKEYGKNALFGFGLVDELVFVHTSKFRFPFSDEIENAGKENFRVKNTLFYGDYLKDRKEYKGQEFIALKDNEALLKNGQTEKVVRLNWTKFPVLDEYRLH